MSNSVWWYGNAFMVTAHGPGKLHLLSYNTTFGGGPVHGAITTTNKGVTRFIVSFSHNYVSYAVMWEGGGEAAYTIGESTQKTPVGRNWNQATGLTWGNPVTINTVNVSSLVPSAIDRNDETTVYIVPSHLK
jgi:hypothetical protein